VGEMISASCLCLVATQAGRSLFRRIRIFQIFALIGFFIYSSVHVWPFSAQHVSFLALRPSTGWHAR
jgi:hypothetical protein